MSRNDNRMEGIFKLIWEKENFLPSKVRIVTQGSKDITCRVKINPASKMEGEIVLGRPPVLINVYSPVKDAYVNEGVPTLNYGKASILKIGLDTNGKRYRTFMDFNITDIPRNMYIAEATLEITSYDDKDFEHLELSSALKEYEEYGLTWANQVARDKIISIEELDKNTKVYKFNVTDIVANEWYGKDFLNHGFILKAYDETKQQVKEFLSKESSYSPKLTVKYIDTTTYESGGAKIDAKVHVRENHSGQMGGKVEVHRYDGFNLLPAKVHVLNKEMFEAQVTVVRRSMLAKATVRSYETIESKVAVRIQGDPCDIIGRVGISQEHVISSVDIRVPKTLRSKVNVAVTTSEPMISNVLINNNIMKSKVEVREYETLISSVQVASIQYEKVNSNVFVNNNIMKSKVNVNAINKLPSKVEIILREKEDFPCKVIINGAKDLKGKVNVVYKSGITAKVEVNAISKIDGKIHVRLTREKNLPAKVKAKAQVTVISRVQVNSQYIRATVDIRKYKLMFGRVNVRSYDGIESNVNVRNYKKLDGIVVVRASHFYDIYCSVKVQSSHSKKRSYVFIM